ncbi:hypothetical protein QMK17_05100 [Rhodococcus sp. G-MC3]|uniref:hypothetical protein n=1 Tax=Rhodococcus sp. G-MC3 TaxID=3046209 RepID=UPI0024BBB92F|nr:hypothetical protein [Rhodococcus sp. G-MC3]MDJ0392703.1 hypothetical protein [Rhodococcus sp. G-MC3]
MAAALHAKNACALEWSIAAPVVDHCLPRMWHSALHAACITALGAGVLVVWSLAPEDAVVPLQRAIRRRRVGAVT